MKEKKCPVCGNMSFAPKFPDIVGCVSCGFMTYSRDITEEEASGLYDHDYFRGREYRDYLDERKLIQRNFRGRLGPILRYIEAPEEKTLYEIGSAYGFFLDLASRYFREVRGIDICDEGTEFASKHFGFANENGDFLKTKLDHKYDVFCLWDTIEHLVRPEKYIEKISHDISRGGLLAVTTGDIGSLNARIRGEKWRQIHPPTHLHYFSRATLLRLLGKYGFTCEYYGYPGTFISMDTIFYTIFALRRSRRGFYDLLKRTGLLKICFYINCFDLLYVLARKI